MEDGDVEGKTCHAYFKGRDGCGTCNKGCQWWSEGAECPAWRKEGESEEGCEEQIEREVLIAELRGMNTPTTTDY